MNRNMKEQLLVCKVTLKRLFTRKSFWILLLLLPILLLGLDRLEQTNEDALKAVVYCQEESLIPLLSEQTNPSFYFVETEAEVKNQVLAGKAECGYVIPGDLFKAFEEDDWYWKVEVYEGSHSMFTKLVNEVLFSQIFKQVSVDWYTRFVEDKLITDVSDIPKEIQQKLTEILANGETFQVQTIRLTDDMDSKESDADRSLSNKDSKGSMVSAKGIVAVMLYLMSLLAVMDVVKDREKRYFKEKLHLSAAFWTIFHPVALVGVSGLIGLLCTGNMGLVPGEALDTLFWHSFGSYLMYVGVTVIYALILSGLVRKSSWMYGLIPVFFVAGLVCCPVFVDLGAVFPLFHWIKWLFPFAFYL